MKKSLFVIIAVGGLSTAFYYLTSVPGRKDSPPPTEASQPVDMASVKASAERGEAGAQYTLGAQCAKGRGACPRITRKPPAGIAWPPTRAMLRPKRRWANYLKLDKE